MLKVYECDSQFNKTMGNFQLSLCKPFIVFALLSSLLLISQSSMNKGLAQAGNLWYVGDGAKKDMYVTYRVQEQDTNAGRPLI